MKTKHTFGFSIDEKEIKNALYDYFVRQEECKNLIFGSQNIIVIGYSDDDGEVRNLEAVLTVTQEDKG